MKVGDSPSRRKFVKPRSFVTPKPSTPDFAGRGFNPARFNPPDEICPPQQDHAATCRTRPEGRESPGRDRRANGPVAEARYAHSRSECNIFRTDEAIGLTAPAH